MANSKKEKFYYIPADTGGEILIYDKNSEFLETKHIEKLNQQDKFGLMCYFIELGLSLQQIHKEKPWALSPTFFLRLKNHNQKLDEMYKAAKKLRIDLMYEKILGFKDSKDSDDLVDRYSKIIKLLSPKQEVANTYKLVHWSENAEDFTQK